MNSKVVFTRKDVFVVLGCVVFLSMTLGAIGSGGRRRAKEAVCLSNLRRMGSAFLMFAEDNDGYFMAGWTPLPTQGPAHKHYWMEALRPYYDNPDLRCCPEATKTWWNADGSTGPGIDGGTFSAWGIFPSQDQCGEGSSWWEWVVACDYGSYGNNAWTCNPPPGYNMWLGQQDPHFRTANVLGASNISLLGDHLWLDCWPNHTDEPPLGDGLPYTSQMSRVCINRHQGFVNWSFLDGSARKVGLKELWKLKWHRKFDTDAPSPPWPEWMRDFEDY